MKVNVVCRPVVVGIDVEVVSGIGVVVGLFLEVGFIVTVDEMRVVVEAIAVVGNSVEVDLLVDVCAVVDTFVVCDKLVVGKVEDFDVDSTAVRVLVLDFTIPVDVAETEVVSLISDVVDKGVSVVTVVLVEDALVTDEGDTVGFIVVLADEAVGIGVSGGTVDCVFDNIGILDPIVGTKIVVALLVD